MTDGRPQIEEIGGLGGWFTPPGLPREMVPGRVKMACVTFLGVYPLTSVLPPLFGSVLPDLHPLVRNVFVTASVVAALTWLVMPALTRLFRAGSTAGRRSSETFGPNAMTIQVRRAAGATLLLACLAGCAPVGPSLTRDLSVAYNDAVQESGQRELMLNIVRLRYTDTPEFLEISNIATEMRIERSLGVGAEFGTVEGETQNLGTASASIGYSESPISRQPRSGEK